MSDDPYKLAPEDRAAEIKRRSEAAKRRWESREAQRWWQRTLSDPVGRAEIWRILDELDSFRTHFPVAPAGVPDKYAVWFKHGRSTYGFELHQHLMVAARDQVMTMHDEHDPRFAKDALVQPNAERPDERDDYDRSD